MFQHASIPCHRASTQAFLTDVAIASNLSDFAQSSPSPSPRQRTVGIRNGLKMLNLLGCFAGLALIAGCSGSHPTASTSATNSSQTPAQAFQSLQQSGVLPTLDVTNTVQGTDSNGNGVRDDLDAYIASLPDSNTKKKALTQLAAAIQDTMTVNTTNSTALAATSSTLNLAVNCVWYQYGSPQAHEKVMLIEELSVNTMTRLNAYEAYNSARNGSATALASGNTCN